MSGDEIMTAHEYAHKYAQCGIRVIPIRPGAKHPPINGWQKAATTNPDTINKWWKGIYDKCGVGLAMGPQPDGRTLFAIDIDRHGPIDGHDELHDLEAEHGELPDTWQAVTGSGGTHLIYRTPPGVTVRNQQSAGNRIGEAIDVRGDGGQIVAAPTIHPDTGDAYHWIDGHAPWELDCAEAPKWIIDLVAEPPPAPPAPPPPPKPDNDQLWRTHDNAWNWHVELHAAGWTPLPNQPPGDDTYWVRPGKDPRDGHSAVLHGDRILVVFTTDIPEAWRNAATPTADGSGWALNPFTAHAAIHHAGDRTQAARTLAERYGLAAPTEWPQNATDGNTGTTDEAANYDANLLGMLLDWQEFFDTDHSAEEWLWRPIIPARRGLVIWAKGGSGKSLVMLRLAVDLARRNIRILYLDYEMSPDDLNDRLAEMGVDDPNDLATLHYAQLPSLPAFDTPEGGMAVNRLAELVDADLVVIDTFARAVAGDENDADTVRQFYRQTGMHLKAAGRAFIRIDHSGKDEAKGQRGSSAKNDDVDLVWHLKQSHTGYTLTRGKSRMGWVPEKVEITRHDDPYRLSVTVDQRGYVAGTSELAALLDDLGIPTDVGERKVVDHLEAAGHPKPRRAVLRDAIRWRRDPLQMAVDNPREVVDKSSKSAPRFSRRTLDDERAEKTAAHFGADEETPGQSTRRTSRRTSAHPSGDTTAQCATRRVAHGAGPVPEDDESMM